MIITHHGKGHIKLVTGDITISISPISKKSKYRQTKYGADIVLIPLDHPDYNGIDNILVSKKEPFIMKSSGEAEVNDIFITAFSDKITRDKKEYWTNSFVFNFDNIRICYIGQITDLLKSEHKEIIDNVDVLFIPVGGDDINISPYNANKITVGLEPKIIIPIDTDEKVLPIFLKESGIDKLIPVDKLTIKRKDIETKQNEIILLSEI